MLVFLKSGPCRQLFHTLELSCNDCRFGSSKALLTLDNFYTLAAASAQSNL